ncbi:MAG: hypothetical protein F4110_12010 [Acidimicrobiaceae bacterium]|nr:hypothetical protein [Acidimicrobiaceae bacterium]MYI54683.1 hypothetical protein [Acidimicrobiaceae bacterium]
MLETVYRIASLDLSIKERSAQLTIALREHTTDADAKAGLKWAVSRVWINPPRPAAAMVRWAIDHPEHFPDRRVMHTGALLATVPFVGSVLGQLGRSFALDETLTVPNLRRRLVARWGETSTVREAVGKTITSLRRLDVVDGGGNQPVTRRARLHASPLATAWLVHAVILCRQASSIEVRGAAAAPELFWADETTPDPDYPHLELHTEALNRRVWVPV